MVVFVLLPGLAKSPKKLMGKSPIFNGKIHYFDWAIWKMSLFVCWNQRITKWSNDNWMMTASCDWVETSKSLWVHSRGKLYPRLYPQVMAEDHMISLVVVEPPTPLKNDGVKVNYGIHMFPKMWENMEKSSNSMVPVTTNQCLLVYKPWNHTH